MKFLILFIFVLGCAAWTFAAGSPDPNAPIQEKKAFKVALLPVFLNSPEDIGYMREGLVDMLSSRMELEGRITVMEKAQVKKILPQLPEEMDSESARKIGEGLGADFVVYGSLTKLGNSSSLDLRVVEVREGKTGTPFYLQANKMEEIVAKVDEISRKIDEKILGYPLIQPVAEKPVTEKPVAEKLVAGKIVAEKTVAEKPVEKNVAEAPKEKTTKTASQSAFQPTKPINVKGGASTISIDFWQSQPFSFKIKGMAIADLDGDGKNEVGLIEDRAVKIYRWEKQEFKLLKTISLDVTGHCLAIDAMDIDKDGKAEFFVTNIPGEKLSSFVVAFRDGDFKITHTGLEWFLRVVNWDERGPVLLGQRKGYQKGFQGPIYEIAWDGKEYKEVRKLDLSNRINVYGFTPYSQGEKMRFVFIDPSDSKMKVADQKGKIVWRSSNTYGSDNSFQVKPFAQTASDEMVFVNVRVLSLEDEIFTIRNLSTVDMFKRQKLYTGSEVESFNWNGVMLIKTSQSQEISGYIADFQYADLDGNGDKQLVLAVNMPKESVFSTNKESTLIVTRINRTQ